VAKKRNPLHMRKFISNKISREKLIKDVRHSLLSEDDEKPQRFFERIKSRLKKSPEPETNIPKDRTDFVKNSKEEFPDNLTVSRQKWNKWSEINQEEEVIRELFSVLKSLVKTVPTEVKIDEAQKTKEKKILQSPKKSEDVVKVNIDEARGNTVEEYNGTAKEPDIEIPLDQELRKTIHDLAIFQRVKYMDERNNMELKKYMHILIRWIWLLLLFTLLGTGIGYVASHLEKPIYRATTKIMVSKDLSDQSSQFASMNNQQLIDAYVQLLSSTSVVDEASRRLNYEIELKEFGSVQQVRTTNVIQITMDDSDSQRSAAIVNTLVEVLMDKNGQASGYSSTEENIKKNLTQVEEQISSLQTQFNQISEEKNQGQLNQVNEQITTLQDQISTLSKEIGTLDSIVYRNAEQNSQLIEKQAQLAQLQSLLDEYQQLRINLEYFGKPALNSSDLGGDLRLQLLQSTLDHYQQIHLSLLDNLQAVQLAHLQNTPTIEQIEKAVPPADPIRPKPLIYTMLAGIASFLFAIGLIFIIEYLDDTLKTPRDVQQALGVPYLGYIPYVKPVTKTKNGSNARQLPFQTSEALYALRTNLEFNFDQPSLKTLLLLSLNEIGIGKTSIATDLAVNYAQSGSKVVLMDADMRNPSIHHYFGLANENGFSDLLADSLKTKAAGKKVEGLDGMTVITGGSASPATDGLLKPEKIGQILEILKQRSDMIIINAPSISTADSWVLASKMDGVLLVIHPRVTHLNEARQGLEQLNRAGATILGVVFCDVPHNLAYFFSNGLIHNRRLTARYGSLLNKIPLNWGISRKP